MTRDPTRTVAALGAALLAGLLLAAAGVGAAAADDGAQDDERLTVTNATVEDGETSRLRLALTDAPSGLSGYRVRLELSNPEVASITGADYPDAFRLTTDPAVGGDGDSVTLEAAVADTPAGATNVTLATVTVTGTGGGETAVRVADAQIDDDNGTRVEPAFGHGGVAVEPLTNAANTDASGQTDDASENAADDPGATDGAATTDADGPGFGPAAVLAALVATALLVRARD